MRGRPAGNSYYSANAARRGLLHFALGKVVSAALGIAFLVLSIRALAPQSYGVYVTLLAAAELFYLVTGLGLSTVAQRYVAEYRLKALAPQFFAFLRRQMHLRLAFSVVAIVLLLLAWQPLMRWTGLGLAASWMPAVALLMLGWAGVSFLEEVMGACLLQGYAQVLSALRNGARVAVVGYSLWRGGGLSLETLVWAEALIALCSWLLAQALVSRWARRSPSAPGALAGFHAADMQAVARKFYVVQLAGQSYGINVTKMLVMRLLGAVEVASFGVAQSVADMVRNYMPAHLLAGWVRPMMVARYVQRRDIEEVAAIVNLVFKLNLICLLPMAAGFFIAGDELMDWLSKGHYPGVGLLLAVMMLGLVLQTLHLLLTMVALTLESARASLQGTFAACLALPVLVLLIWRFGTLGAALAMLVTELIWIGVAWATLSAQGHRLRFDFRAWGKIALATVAAALVSHWVKWDGPTGLVVALAALGLSFLALLLVLRPQTDTEIQLLRQLFKRRQTTVKQA